MKATYMSYSCIAVFKVIIRLLDWFISHFTMDQITQFVEPLKEFSKDSIRLVKRCTKPDRKGIDMFSFFLLWPVALYFNQLENYHQSFWELNWGLFKNIFPKLLLVLSRLRFILSSKYVCPWRFFKCWKSLAMSLKYV